MEVELYVAASIEWLYLSWMFVNFSDELKSNGGSCTQRMEAVTILHISNVNTLGKFSDNMKKISKILLICHSN